MKIYRGVSLKYLHFLHIVLCGLSMWWQAAIDTWTRIMDLFFPDDRKTSEKMKFDSLYMTSLIPF